ncbi:MAG: hypothetical protein G8D81_15175 [gamma proteobacterium symbiont of Clathrolucina costata]|uniref:Uncharacterized protein n=1 Tax=Candidatus Thiodiazotropha taylori TaxID=2792791 RepID=A0A9E4NNY2_9GAMM|nr:hypothetical protein [Candidatus Thiodiazotropha endolucinida]MCG7981019.1 hypothetical protein [Candidatus Thiodiazotropha taylori]MCG8044751.1 hypothetical protein [Candidatus Thiodiazotropha taylori]MCW4239163.1 hypothetical protein [Candidatus Thiodiazotropha endolucinida]MCW4342436.1 hypothetical protein [Candidatus Thiodiazotropha endolucinida]
MKLLTDPKSYLEQQEVFTGEMIARIADILEIEGIKGEKLKELTGKLAFEVTCMIDDVSGIEFDGVEASPYLTFLSKDQEIIHLGGNSTTHEMVYGILNAMFRKNT